MNGTISTIIGLIILVLDIWAIISVLRSDRDAGAKVGWTLLIIILPLLGLIIWGIVGPRGHRPVTSQEHSKG